MKTHHTTPKHREVRVSKNEDLIGYVMTCEERTDGAHVQFWYDTHTRCWFCSAYDADRHALNDSDNSYHREDIESLALRRIDDLVDGEFDRDTI
jgi:hypothetical protein